MSRNVKGLGHMAKGSFVPKIVAGLMIAGTCAGVAGFMAGCQTAGSCGNNNKKGCVWMDNKVFYKDGKFDQDKAKQAYYNMMDKFGYTIFDELKRPDGPFWAVDFGKGEFTSFGMGGVIWCNETEGYFGHEIYLLPGQNIAEHRHLPTKGKDGQTIRCKIESWQVRHGTVYGFSEVGEPNLDQFPEAKAMLAKCQIPHLKSVHVQKWEADGKVHKLAAPETWHFMQAGPEGAIVFEFATFHDNAGLRFTVPGTAL